MAIKTYKEYKQIIDGCPIKVAQIYKHYKGNYYQIIHISLDSDTLEPIIHYRGKGFAEGWSLPLREFTKSWLDNNCKFIQRFVLANPLEGV